MLKPSEEVSRERGEFQLGELSPKALDFLINSDAPINIAYGAVRSSKTTTATLRWLQYIAESPHNEFLQTGKTRSTLYRNVLRDQMKMLNAFNIEYNHLKYDGILEIEDKVIWLVGFRDERVSEIIRGMTVGGWYGDEVTTYPKTAVEHALDRCSLKDSKVFWTLNPSSPYHYIYTDYISNKRLRKNGDVKVWHFMLDDNPHLPKSYKEQIIRRYPPGTVQYKRKVEGLWVVAEGIIYDHFVEEQHTFTDPPYGGYDYYVLSTDYGISTVTVHGLFGIKSRESGNEYHLLREYYYDAERMGKQRTDAEHVDEALKLLNGLDLHAWFIPHDAASLRAEAQRRTYKSRPLPVYTYTPNTIEDIREIQKVIAENRFRIHTSCKNSIQQAQTYSWDKKAQEKGIDKPLKENDHCPDMWRGAIIGSRYITQNPYSTTNRRYKTYRG